MTYSIYELSHRFAALIILYHGLYKSFHRICNLLTKIESNIPRDYGFSTTEKSK